MHAHFSMTSFYCVICTVFFLLTPTFTPLCFLFFSCARGGWGNEKYELHTFPLNQMASDYEANISVGQNKHIICTHSYTSVPVFHQCFTQVISSSALYCVLWQSFVESLFFLPSECTWTPIDLHVHTHTNWEHPSLPEAMNLLSDIDPVVSGGITTAVPWRLDIEIHQIYIQDPHWFGGLSRETEEERRK